jgi:hypothetical protein
MKQGIHRAESMHNTKPMLIAMDDSDTPGHNSRYTSSESSRLTT